jgi:hypothetical protein
MGKEAYGQLFLQVLRFSPVSVIPPIIRAHSFICHQRYTDPATDSVIKQHPKTSEEDSVK